jgi:hypothetical protein
MVSGVAVAASTPTTVPVVATTVPVPAPPPSPASPPCNVAATTVNGVPYYRCGTTWYTEGYGSSGVVYMPVASPPGY